MKKKVKLAVLLGLCLLCLAGWGKKTVDFLNNQKLIDLEAALQNCLHGDSMSESDYNTDNDKEPESTQVPDTPTDPKEDIDQERVVIIRVRERKITYDTEEIELNKLEHRIRQDYHEKLTYQLVEDYAEAHVYRRIRGILAGLKAELGLEYTEMRGE